MQSGKKMYYSEFNLFVANVLSSVDVDFNVTELNCKCNYKPRRTKTASYKDKLRDKPNTFTMFLLTKIVHKS